MSRITLVLALMASFLVCAECSERGTSSESPSLAKGISAQERRALVALYEPQKETQTIGAIAHRHCRLIWLILHQGVRYEELGPAVSQKSKQARTTRVIRQLRTLGYRIEPPNPPHLNPPQGQRFSSLL